MINIDSFIEQIRDWANSIPTVSGVLLVGSHARNAATPSSDIDLVILTEKTRELLQLNGWINEFGLVKSSEVEDWGNLTSLRVFYEDGKEVEYGIAKSDWASIPVDPGAENVIRDGAKIIVDKSGKLQSLLDEVFPRD